MNWMLKYVSHDKCYKHYIKEQFLNFCFAISPANKSRFAIFQNEYLDLECWTALHCSKCPTP